MTTPKNITQLNSNQIFVFGSNLNGNHAGGAAKTALQWGAIEGQGEGLQGQTYAFPTLDTKMKKVSIKEFKESIAKLYKCAEENPAKEFLVTKLGCGIAGFNEEEVKKLFKGDKPKNIVLPVGWSIVKGYKAFNKGLTCRGFKYKLGKDFYHKGEISLCNSGFHFCKSLGSVYNYYNFGDDIVVAEVESEGDVIDEENKEKSVTNHIRIIRILNAEQAMNNNGLNNLGHSNTGDSNTGHSNTGYWNTGHSNTGNSNTGDSNTGYSNTGYRNTGNWNTGDWNTGDSNTGYRNTGHSNTGHSNTGYSNTGNWNTGHSNTGYRNTGDRNTGDWNTTSFNTGSFNNKEIKEVLVFNKMCKKEKWDIAIKPSCLYFETKQFIDFSNMRDEEKVRYPQASYQGGYIKDIPFKEAFTKSMENASQEDIELVKKLPNFNKKVFYEISGFKIK